MPSSREVVLLDTPDLVDDYLTVRLAPLGRVACLNSRSFDDQARVDELLERTLPTDVVVWLPEAGDDTSRRRAVEVLLPGVAVTGGCVLVLSSSTTPPARTTWLRELTERYPTARLHLVRHEPVAGAFWDCRGELQTLTTRGHVPLPELATAVAEAIADRTPGFRETALTPDQEIA
ncbi:hypothetical protein FE697_012375 [Mumia zhuanghuii]|uniref:Uncharacterized protein n=2 Tax=Mumia TaxID=1546255 RepID=A0ABW1QEY0_9ACTN|nr:MULTISPECIES: hypothetical protein [Mumia]KAA1422930.1 hypothetical protein FE697_012375 [Mumia zhuanghuii]